MIEQEIVSMVACAAGHGRSVRVGVMGGSFDPIHVGHTSIADAAQDELALDAMIYIPAGVPSFKRDRRLASGEDRLAMVRLAIEGRPGCSISACEVARRGVTYTADTLDQLSDALPGPCDLVLVMGADAYRTLPQWHRAEDIARSARIAWARREGDDPGDVRREVAASGLPVVAYELRAQAPDVSSTGIRSAILRGEGVDGLVDPAVLRYIREHGLYTAR